MAASACRNNDFCSLFTKSEKQYRKNSRKKSLDHDFAEWFSQHRKAFVAVCGE